MIWPWRKRRPDSEAASGPAPGPTGRIDRLIVQQHDPRQTVTIGGIDTCMRGILDYAPPGRGAGARRSSTSTGQRQVGRRPVRSRSAGGSGCRRGGRDVWFLPVARIDTSRPKGFLPYSARLVAGLLRYRTRIPRARDRAGPPGGQRASSSACCSAARSCTASTPRSEGCWARRPSRSGGSRGGSTSGSTGDREAGRAGDRVQPRLRGEGAAVEPAHGVRAHLVRPRHHPAGPPTPQLARGHLGGQARGPEGPGAGRACVRRSW